LLRKPRLRGTPATLWHIDLTPLTPLISSLALPFVTVDLALRVDGIWRVIELGDGQVSDRPTTTEPFTFLNAALTP
jgi:hypothetical protein